MGKMNSIPSLACSLPALLISRHNAQQCIKF